MVTFGGEANYFNGFFQAQKFDSLRRSGGSALGDALLLGVELLRTFPPLGRNLIVFSDGESNSGHLYYKEVAEIAKKNNIKIYAFAFGYEKEFSFPIKNGGVSHLSNVFDFDPLKEICETTGGKFHWVDKTDKLIELPIIQGLE